MNLRKKKSEPEKITQALFIIDESGSMDYVKKQTIIGINEQIQELKKHPEIITKVTVVTFNGEVKDVLVNKPLSKLDEFDGDTYHPSGMTALYDAVAETIKREQKRKYKTKDVTRIVIIVTDGEENASSNYSRSNGGAQKIADLIKEVESKGWTVTYLGANQDLTEVHETLGIKMSNMASYNATNTGTSAAFACASIGLGSYMNKRSMVKTNYLQSADYGISDKFFNETESITNVPEEDKDVKPS